MRGAIVVAFLSLAAVVSVISIGVAQEPLVEVFKSPT